MAPQWLTDGTRVLCTLIEIPENHVISAVDPATWFRTSSVGKRKAFTRFGPFWKVTVGAGNVSPAFLSDPYRRMFEKIGVPAKQTLGSFLVTEDAVIEPGTRLDVRHFSVGQFVNVTGKTIDWGFQGVVHRWGMKGQPKRNTTKAHRRVGSIGITSQAKVWLGKRLPGHMGYEWGTVRGLEVLRINPIKQVMYIKGAVPGDMGEMVLIKDIIVGAKRVQKPPFPTYCISEEEEKNDEQNSQLSTATAIISKDIYSPKLFNFTSPSIIFKDTDDVKSTARDRTKAKLAKVKK
uniref:Large ribosomal subunit protein uL3m n=2 Tax=Acrobeloides nanus TaxID=290746 RepID=A0A914CGN7_9BILA